MIALDSSWVVEKYLRTLDIPLKVFLARKNHGIYVSVTCSAFFSDMVSILQGISLPLERKSTMARFCPPCCFYFTLSVFAFSTLLHCSSAEAAVDRKLYVVYMGSIQEGQYEQASFQHHTLLDQVLDASNSVSESLVRSYGRSFNGFSAKLTDEEAKRLSRKQGVVSVFPSRTMKLKTTRSWDFVGLNHAAKRVPAVETNTIIGVIDSGIWPESESFGDKGLGPIPKKWKGACDGGRNFTCNKKLIGARFYKGQQLPPWDTARDSVSGHGSHTASTAAGSTVSRTSLNGLALGTVKGGVPSARIAVYRVCDDSGCTDADILAAFDDAIADGVDIISVSLGPSAAGNITQDSVAVGGLHALKKGILTVQAAGNEGPGPGTLGSVAPWLFTVAASTIDRKIIDTIVLGNGKNLTGLSVNVFNKTGSLPVVYGAHSSSGCSEIEARMCDASCLLPDLRNKILVCDDVRNGVLNAPTVRAAGVILPLGAKNYASLVPLPAILLDETAFTAFKSYINSTKAPTANILPSFAVNDSSAPWTASFSSRGPNTIVPDILKPDISAPGVTILAAFSPTVPPSDVPGDTRAFKYNILSGTSMACPHVSGAAAYVKTFHPEWSPSAIKSALMTTALPMKSIKQAVKEFAYGSGNIDPIKATHPGLVYDISAADFSEMLCSTGLNPNEVKLISGDRNSCRSQASSPKSLSKDLNYPALTYQFSRGALNVQFNRTVTNVGPAKSVYRVEVVADPEVTVTVKPDVLTFKSEGEKLSFVVTVVGKNPSSSVISSSLVWSDGTHSVRSPIVIYK